ncbi:MAG: hypothetical protein K2N47_01850 [Clostridia bacterium]|nr:hypothetical protein [Clostridia bacterium]
MVLRNPKPNRKKRNTYVAFQIILPIIFVGLAIFETIYFIKVLFPQHGDSIWFYLVLSYVVCIILSIVAIVTLGKGADKYASTAKIGNIGIAFCKCGYTTQLSDLQYKIDENSIKTKYNENESGTYSSAEATGTLIVRCTCRMCHSVLEAKIYNVLLGSASDSYRRKWFTTDPGTTYVHSSNSNVTSERDLQNIVMQRYYADLRNTENTLNYYKKLGYVADDGNIANYEKDINKNLRKDRFDMVGNDKELQELVEMEMLDEANDEDKDTPIKG